jgi:hypothetical protein
MVLVAALAVAAAVLLREAVAHRRARTLLRDALLAFGPAAALTAWWYVRTWVRFGDPTGSDLLADRLHRVQPPGGILARLVDVSMWQHMVGKLTASSYDYYLVAARPGDVEIRVPAAAWAAALLAVVAAVGLLLPRGLGGRRVPPVRGWPLLVAAVLGIGFGVAGHTSQGGAAHARYLLPAWPVLALLTVIGLDRVRRGLSTIAVGGATAASITVLVLSVRWIDRIAGATELRRFGPAALGWVGAAVAVAGIVTAVAAAPREGRTVHRRAHRRAFTTRSAPAGVGPGAAAAR